MDKDYNMWGSGFWMEKNTTIELQQLIQLTQKFLTFTQSLLEKGSITQDQYIKMTEQKLHFLEKVKTGIEG
ncbi:MAG: hypothetical protein GX347_05835 [Epulopiscium sp.]|nr:hypothetical protein [Candidatus Epulonipiscium sp.]